MTPRKRALAFAFVLSCVAAVALAGNDVETLPPTNSQLLSQAAQAVARKLVQGVPVTSGSRVFLRAEGDEAADRELADAFILALNQRKIHAEIAPAAPAAGAGTAPSASSAAESSAVTVPGMSTTDGGKPDFVKLQEQRLAQAARADSIARATQSGATAPVDPERSTTAPGDAPVLTFRTEEARVDYVRQFRGGLFGAERIERRAGARATLRLTPAGSEAVSWSAMADTSVGDIVLKSQLPSLEDRQRPETRPTPPPNNAKKIIEPIIVVLLVAGLVSLFYQNRP